MNLLAVRWLGWFSVGIILGIPLCMLAMPVLARLLSPYPEPGRTVNWRALAMTHTRQTWGVTISGTKDVMAVRDALFAIEEGGFGTGVHLSAILPYVNNETTIQHWCRKDKAQATAARLARAGFAARVTDNEPG